MGVLRYTYYVYQSETALGVAFQLSIFTRTCTHVKVYSLVVCIQQIELLKGK